MRECIRCRYDCKTNICAHSELHEYSLGGCDGECHDNKLARCVEVGTLLVWDEVEL